MKRMLSGLVALALAFASISPLTAVAAKSTPEVFKVNAVFAGASLTGTVTIDTTGGTIVSSDLVLDNHLNGHLATLSEFKLLQTRALCYEFSGESSDYNEVVVVLYLFPVTTLKGFEGSRLISNSYWEQYFPNGFDNRYIPEYLSSGTIEPE